MNNLDYYLTDDHAARSRTTLFSVLTAGAAAFITAQFDASLRAVAIVCIIVVTGVEVGRAWFYVQPASRGGARSSSHYERLSLVFAALFLLAIGLSILFPTSRIEAAVTERTLRQNAANPTDPENIKETEVVLSRAEKANLRLKPDVVEKAAAKFLEAAGSSKSAWGVAIAFAEYRSTLTNEPPLPPLNKHPEADTWYGYSIPHGELSPVFSHYGIVPISRAAIFDKIGVNRNPGPIGDAFLVGVGGTLYLDDTQARKAILRGTTIFYEGGPVELDDVYFVDCKFVINQSPNGLALAQALLKASPSVSFRRAE